MRTKKTQKPSPPRHNSAANGTVHLPVLAETAVQFLHCSPGNVIVDATIGGGGHARLILERIGRTGTLIGIDWDHTAIERVRSRFGAKTNLTLVRENFRNLATILENLGVAEIDALRFSAMFAADSDFQILFNFSSKLSTHFHEFSDACLVKFLERVVAINTMFDILTEEFTGIIS